VDTFTNDGFTFEVTDAGPSDGELIVLLHGFPESRSSWREVIPQLTHAGYRVLAPNQRGYSRGARPKQRSMYTMPKLAGDIVALLDQAGVEKCHVVGHDWGGGVMWQLASAHADRLHTATSLTTPHPRAMLKAGTRSTQLLKSYYMFLFQLPFLPEQGFTGPMRKRTWQAMQRFGLKPEFAAEYARLFEEPGAARGAINWYRGLFFGSPTGVTAITDVPVMYLYGTKDFALGRKAADLTADYVQSPYRYEVLEGVSHWMPEEIPSRVSELLLDFIESA
jgi:pimeloyl-ACP methyl ester carboxylesterase